MAACQGPASVPELSSSSGRSATAVRSLKVHSESERRRRERINTHLATLRRMIPDANQMDKATLLACVVNQVKELKRKATETTRLQATALIPPEANEMTVDCYTAAGDNRTTCIRATVSCDDRPGLFVGLAEAFRGLGLRMLRTETASLGGRACHVFVLCKEGGDVGAGLRTLEWAVRQAMGEVVFPEMACGDSSWSKRERILEGHCPVMYSV
ncbi:Transcription factor bHLH51 [Hordeum vulgare]|uniref:BHLH domain-containing protein n=2 Tax=Hordeum vulgare subsp. vulgare TaxID=112509 RepID=A0A8I6WQX4_HORVV|nr:transcription factor AIG1-like [Hordeum vulgare subsp. vulgare]KAE8789332.1 Transcription factor bHLH51 [Hordeum vulgare]